MKTIQFNYEQHASMVNKWAEKHSFPLPPKEYLPETGLIVEDTAAGFVYLSNSNLAWVEWIFSNPEKSPEERQESIDSLMSTLEKIAIAHGAKALFSSSGSEGYRKVLERNGFTETDKNVIQHIKRIG
jgi:hypothetical protein